jgi:hypothetical protein
MYEDSECTVNESGSKYENENPRVKPRTHVLKK